MRGGIHLKNYYGKEGGFIKNTIIIIIIILILMLPNIVVANDKIDLRRDMPPITDQGITNTCVSHAFSTALGYQIKKDIDPYYIPSPVFIHHMAKGGVYGIPFEKAYETLSEYGLSHMTYHPYQFEWWYTPSLDAIHSAQQYNAKSFAELDIYGDMQQVIDYLKKGYPVIINTNNYRWGRIGKDGICREALNWKDINNKNGHAMVIVGYDPFFIFENNQIPIFIVRNSYGMDFGDYGYAYVPADKLWDCNIASAWVVSINDDLPSIPQLNYMQNLRYVETIIYSIDITNQSMKYSWYAGEIGYHGILFFDVSEDINLGPGTYKRYAKGYIMCMEIGGWTDEAIKEKNRLEEVSKRFWIMRNNL